MPKLTPNTAATCLGSNCECRVFDCSSSMCRVDETWTLLIMHSMRSCSVLPLTDIKTQSVSYMWWWRLTPWDVTRWTMRSFLGWPVSYIPPGMIKPWGSHGLSHVITTWGYISSSFSSGYLVLKNTVDPYKEKGIKSLSSISIPMVLVGSVSYWLSWTTTP